MNSGSNQYTSLYGTTDIEATNVSTGTLNINSNPLGVGGYQYTFPDINDTVVTQTKTQPITNKAINSSSIGLLSPSDAKFVDLDVTNITDTYRLKINGVEVILANLFDKTTDDTDDITEGKTNRFDHITASLPLVRTLDNLTINTASGSQTGALSNSDWTTFMNKENVLSFSSPLNRSLNTVSINNASGSQTGALTSSDWTTFNNKENVLSFSGPLSRSVNTISIGQVSASTDGYMSASQYNSLLASAGLWYSVTVGPNTYQQNLRSIYLQSGTGILMYSPVSLANVACINSSNVHTASTYYNENLSFQVNGSGAISGSSLNAPTISGTTITASGNINTTTGAYQINGVNVIESNRTVNGIIYQISGNTVISSTRLGYLKGLYMDDGVQVLDTIRNAQFNSVSINENGVFSPTTVIDSSRSAYFLNLYINGTQAMDSARNFFAYQLYVNGTRLSDPSRNVDGNTYYINGNTVIDVNRYGYLNLLYINGNQAIDGSRNFYGTSVDISGQYKINNKNAIDTRGTSLVIGAQDLNTTIYTNTQSYNLFIGRTAGQLTLNSGFTPSYCIGIGNAGCLTGITSGSWNVALGNYCQTNNNGSQSVSIGGYSQYTSTVMNNVVSVGMYSHFSTGSIGDAVAVGYMSQMYGHSTSGNTSVGAYSLQNFYNNSGGSVAVGYRALNNVNDAYNNTAVGYYAMGNASIVAGGNHNCSVGYFAGAGITSASSNTMTGSLSGETLTTGFGNVFTGYRAGYGVSTNAYNTVTGYDARVNNGAGNSCYGAYSYSNNGGSYCTSIGYNASAGSASYQVCLGYLANGSLNNVDFGHFVNPSISGISSGSYLIVNGNGQWGPLVSSRRYKKNIRVLNQVIDTSKILQCEPVMYDAKSDDGKNIVGFIAEQVNEHTPDLVFKRNGECESVDYARVSVYLVDVVKKQQDKITTLENKVITLEQKINKLCAMFNIV